MFLNNFNVSNKTNSLEIIINSISNKTNSLEIIINSISNAIIRLELKKNPDDYSSLGSKDDPVSVSDNIVSPVPNSSASSTHNHSKVYITGLMRTANQDGGELKNEMEVEI